MFILFLFGAFFSGFVTMAIAEQKGFDKWLGFAIGPIACTGLLFFLSAIGLFGDEKYQPVGQYSQYGYGSTLEECMQKASDWFEHSRGVALEVIADEKKQGFYDSYSIDRETDDIMSSLRLELGAYQNECLDYYK